jgi:hypothetical protein
VLPRPRRLRPGPRLPRLWTQLGTQLGTQLWTLLLALLAVASTTPGAQAQSIKKGDWYEDTTRIGFRIRAPKDWRFVPAKLNDPIELGRYAPANDPYITLPGGTSIEVTNWLLSFDIGKLQAERIEQLKKLLSIDDLADAPATVDLEEMIPPIEFEATLDRWVEQNVMGQGWTRLEESAERFGDVEGREIQFGGRMQTFDGRTHALRLYVAVMPLEGEKYVVSAFNTHEGEWSKASKACRALAKTFTVVPVETFEFRGESSGDFRDAKRRALHESIATTPGWWLHETPNYFILSDSDDVPFIEEIGDRLEAIRALYTVDYPEEDARQVVDDEGATVASISPLQRSRLSVVRICSDRAMYSQYGGPGGSAGYWSSYHEELVFFDDRKGSGRSDTFAVLNHEAFHQYIFYFYGNLAPHSWYNEGTGDFYSGYQFNPKRKQFKLTPFSWRRELAKNNARSGNYVPLKELVRYTQSQYYGNNDYDISGGENYAQGWSFIWFMRHGAGKPKNWNSAWDPILDTYLRTLAETGDLDQAVDVAFDGVDWDELEACWKAYIT